MYDVSTTDDGPLIKYYSIDETCVKFIVEIDLDIRLSFLLRWVQRK
jgi:hypothetical protein